MKKQFILIAGLLAVMLMAGLGTNLKSVNNEIVGKTISFSLIQATHAHEHDETKKSDDEAKAAVKVEVEKMPNLPGANDSPETELDAATFLRALIKSVGSFKGASALMLVALVLQLLLLFFRTKFAAFAGKWKLLVVYVLSLAAGVLALKVTVPGMEWLAALVHSNTLAAAQVLGHQMKKQFWDKKDEKSTSL